MALSPVPTSPLGLSGTALRSRCSATLLPTLTSGALSFRERRTTHIDLIVMGVYGHSRLREVILGGASRALLSRMTVPVLMAH